MLELPVQQSPHFSTVEFRDCGKLVCPGGKVENYVDNLADPGEIACTC